MPQEQKRVYLGDGLYAELENGDMVVLAASDGISDINVVYLDPEVLDSFLVWLKDNRLIKDYSK